MCLLWHTYARGLISNPVKIIPAQRKIFLFDAKKPAVIPKKRLDDVMRSNQKKPSPKGISCINSNMPMRRVGARLGATSIARISFCPNNKSTMEAMTKYILATARPIGKA
jgi:ribosomal protein L11